MSTPFGPQPHLRLAPESIEHPLLMQAWALRREAAEAIARENRNAASQAPEKLAPHDPRWVLAARAYAQLQGTTMTPERRERVLKTARRLGVRTFDASLIIAIVQDHARCGRALGDAQPLLGMIARPADQASRARGRSVWVRWLGAIVLAAAANAILIWWLTGLGT